MLFASAAVATGVLLRYGAVTGRLVDSGIYSFGRIVVYQILNVYA